MICIVISWGLGSGIGAAADKTISVGEEAGLQGQTVDMAITIENKDDPGQVGGIAFTLTYDPGCLVFSGLTPVVRELDDGADYPDPDKYTEEYIEDTLFYQYNADDTAGKVLIASASAEAFPEGTVFEASFKIDDNCPVTGDFEEYAITISPTTIQADPDNGYFQATALPVLTGIPDDTPDPDGYFLTQEFPTVLVSGKIMVAEDFCLSDPDKTEPGECGCGVSDIDTDNDGTRDCLDVDDDDDGMRDDWEIQFGLAPLVANDASQDIDGDGITNFQEFLDGTDPEYLVENLAPDPPVLSKPADGQDNVSLTPLLETENFSDPDNDIETGIDTHLQTEWQVSTAAGFSEGDMVLHVTSYSHRVSLPVPQLLLIEGETYYWRARFYDDQLFASDWSDGYSFTTLATDKDQEPPFGIPDDQQVDDIVDLNNDSQFDNDQSDDMKSVNTAVGNGQMGVSRLGDAKVLAIEEIESIDPGTVSQCSKPSFIPLGLLGFRLSVAQPGDAVFVTVYFSLPAPEDARWFWYNAVDGWMDYSKNAKFSADRKSVVLYLKDGAFGDADGIENSTIVEPGAYGLASWIDSRIHDDTGKGIPNALITFANHEPVTQNRAQDGGCVFMILPGTYSVTVAAEGYRDRTIRGFVVPAGEIVPLDIQLDADIPSEAVYVPPSPPPPPSPPESGSGGGCFLNTFNTEQELPQPGRDIGRIDKTKRHTDGLKNE